MSFAPVLLIPIYNHAEAIKGTVEALLAHGLPILIVDDGSTDATPRRLEELAADHPSIHVFRAERNEGKGAAVMRGLREARAAGFTHALQIDADGQHDATAVPRFIDTARAHPEALVSGVPVFDASVPRARAYGRYLTHFWVAVETLSLAIGDAMCGCRVYPVAATVALIDARRISQRMDFDIDIAVRLCWTGMPVLNLPIRVIYPETGVSHFDLWRDNLRITRMHTRLVFGMLARLPLLLWRRCRPREQRTHWSRLGERGAAWGLASVYAVYRLFGRRGAQLLLRPVVAYFFLTGKRARVASLDYLRRAHAYFGPLPELVEAPDWRDSFRHFYRFATAALDKVIAWRGEIEAGRVCLEDTREIDALSRSGQGALVIGSHLGNLEMCRALGAQAGHRKINAVVYSEHAANFARLVAAANPQAGFNLLHVRDFGPDTAIALKEKVDRGEWLVIVGDRTPVAENGRSVNASFLGALAPFAQGPYILAHLLQCPVYLLTCLREGGSETYRIRFEAFAERIALPRQGREAAIAQWAARYAAMLEANCRRAPFEWFNFFDFWRPAARSNFPSSPAASEAPAIKRVSTHA